MTPPRPSVLSYLLLAPFEVAICVAALVSSVVALVIQPDPIVKAAIGQSAQGLLPVWEVLYAIGAAVTLSGLLLQSVRVEIAGLSVFFAALLLNALAISNFTGSRGVVSATTYAALALACAGRTFALMRVRKALSQGPKEVE